MRSSIRSILAVYNNWSYFYDSLCSWNFINFAANQTLLIILPTISGYKILIVQIKTLLVVVWLYLLQNYFSMELNTNTILYFWWILHFRIVRLNLLRNYFSVDLSIVVCFCCYETLQLINLTDISFVTKSLQQRLKG